MGNGKRVHRYQTVSHVEFLHKKQAVRCVKNDEFNWQRAVFIAQVYADAEGMRFSSAAQRSRFITKETSNTSSLELACKRFRDDCAPFDTVHEFLEKAAQWLGSHVSIHVWTSITQTASLRYGSTAPSVTLKLILSMEGERSEDDVLYVLTNPKAFNCKRHQCETCGLMYQHNHSCHAAILAHKGPLYRCELCRKPFTSEESRDYHEENCVKEICEQCRCVYSHDDERESDEHVCGEFYCRSCKVIANPDHLCCLQPLKIMTLAEQAEELRNHAGQCVEGDIAEAIDTFDPFTNHKIIVFDVETEASTGLHIPILICSKRSTDMVEFTFGGATCLNDFGKWLFAPHHDGFNVLAHNFSGFDGSFLMKYLETSFIDPDIMLRGNKIVVLTVKEWNIRCIDFLLFAPMKLSKLPKAFGIPDAAKTFFPHKFSSPDTLHYIGRLPDQHYYSPNEMNSADRTDFLKWYEESLEQQQEFNYWETLVTYCRNDVDILMQAVLKYRTLFMSLSDGIDPFDYTTLPQACFATFRARHLPEETFGILPPNGYESSKAQSNIARLWMAYETRNDGEHVRTKFDNGEQKVVNFHVDGSTSKRLLEFYGCYYHGCPKCFQASGFNRQLGKTFGQLYRRTLVRQQTLERRKPVTVMFECEWRRLLRTSKDVAEYVRTLNFRPTPEPTLYGGRCEVFQSLVTATDTTKIEMGDFNSMYPYIMRTFPMPKQHPTVYSCNFPSVETWINKIGLAHVKVSVPDNLLIPILKSHIKCGGYKKLMAVLCTQCANDQTVPPCPHSTAETRYVEGTYTTPLLKLALENGYAITTVYNLWIYEKSTTTLFRSYIDAFFKIKLAASGYPSNVITESQKQAYVNELNATENLNLTTDEVEYNEGKRSLVKFYLNNLWGKTSQNPNPLQTVIASTKKQFMDIILNPDYEDIQWVDIANDTKLKIQFRKKEHAASPPLFSNKVYGCFVTAYGHEMLWKAMKAVGLHNVIYVREPYVLDLAFSAVLYELCRSSVQCDTDSVAYTYTPGEQQSISALYGSKLGDLSTVAPTDTTITEFAAPGKKMYSMELTKADGSKTAVVKAKGVRMSCENEDKLNHLMFKNLVQKIIEKVTVNYATHFQRSNTLSSINTVPLSKVVKSTLNARYYYVFRSVPWGWRASLS